MAAPKMDGAQAAGSQDPPQDQQRSLEAACDPDFPENEAWNDVSELLEGQSGHLVYQDFQKADSTPEFQFWLSGLLDTHIAEAAAPWPQLPDSLAPMEGSVSLVSCPCDVSRARALRSVGFVELKEKAKAITVVQKWRLWDVLEISRMASSRG